MTQVIMVVVLVVAYDQFLPHSLLFFLLNKKNVIFLCLFFLFFLSFSHTKKMFVCKPPVSISLRAMESNVDVHAVEHIRLEYRKCDDCACRVKRLPKDCLPESRYFSGHRLCKRCYREKWNENKESDEVQRMNPYKCEKCDRRRTGLCIYCRQETYFHLGLKRFICDLCL